MKFQDFITMEEQAVMQAVATNSVDKIMDGDINEINKMLHKSRQKRFEK